MTTRLVYDAWIVYHKSSTQEVARYTSRGWAMRRARKLGPAYAMCGEVDYRNRVVGVKTVKNLMTGAYVKIASNTPLACDPSSEIYWSM